MKVVVYSHDADTRAAMKLAIGASPAPDAPDAEIIEVATSPALLRLLDAGGADVTLGLHSPRRGVRNGADSGNFCGRLHRAIPHERIVLLLCSAAAVAAFRARTASGSRAPGGRIVNVSARPAIEPRLGAGMTAYTASKSAVAALTQALAQELTDEQIWVNAVAPSILDTPANRAAMPEADHSRWVSPADLAALIIFLASPDNRATRGAVIPVYGGS